MAEIVLVHGIDQQESSAEELERAWIPALKRGLIEAGRGHVAARVQVRDPAAGGFEARVAFYGDLFLAFDAQGPTIGDLPPDLVEIADALALEWLEHAAERASDARERSESALVLAAERGDLAETQGTGQIAAQAVKHLTRLRRFAPIGLNAATRAVGSLAQVSLYLGDEKIRERALDTVRPLLGPETRVLIGHSLGSVVAFEAATELALPLPLLMTLGSPLGIQNIVYHRLRKQPPGFPPAVGRWVNFADPDDFVAAEPDLRRWFQADMPSGSTFEGRLRVNNHREPHSAVGYLAQRDVGTELADVLA